RLTLTPVLREGFGLALDANGRVQLFNGQRPVWSDFKKVLAGEVAAFRAADCDWNSTVASAIARHSIQDLLVARGASRVVVAMAQGLRGFFLADADRLSALVAVELAMQAKDPGHQSVSRIKGGNDRLVEALATQPKLKISLQSIVDGIEQDTHAVRVRISGGSKRRTILNADYAVLSIPPMVARTIAWSPAPPAPLRRAWQTLAPGPATKAHARFDKGWWRKHGRPRAWGSNLDTGAIWETAGTGPPCLTFLAGGRASEAFRSLLEEGGPQRVVKRLAWLGEPEPARDFRSVSWEFDRYAQGGYAVFGPDFLPQWRAELSRSFGRIALAGEHTSREWQGYMNGAVESGQRAARDIEIMHSMRSVGSAPT
ncbi:MAG TPA: NAD(P)/FAD-dependent oxidoreductase, partial [Vicinamibacterales bacterium]